MMTSGPLPVSKRRAAAVAVAEIIATITVVGCTAACALRNLSDHRTSQHVIIRKNKHHWSEIRFFSTFRRIHSIGKLSPKIEFGENRKLIQRLLDCSTKSDAKQLIEHILILNLANSLSIMDQALFVCRDFGLETLAIDLYHRIAHRYTITSPSLLLFMLQSHIKQNSEKFPDLLSRVVNLKIFPQVKKDLIQFIDDELTITSSQKIKYHKVFGECLVSHYHKGHFSEIIYFTKSVIEHEFVFTRKEIIIISICCIKQNHMNLLDKVSRFKVSENEVLVTEILDELLQIFHDLLKISVHQLAPKFISWLISLLEENISQKNLISLQVLLAKNDASISNLSTLFNSYSRLANSSFVDFVAHHALSTRKILELGFYLYNQSDTTLRSSDILYLILLCFSQLGDIQGLAVVKFAKPLPSDHCISKVSSQFFKHPEFEISQKVRLAIILGTMNELIAIQATQPVKIQSDIFKEGIEAQIWICILCEMDSKLKELVSNSRDKDLFRNVAEILKSSDLGQQRKLQIFDILGTNNVSHIPLKHEVFDFMPKCAKLTEHSFLYMINFVLRSSVSDEERLQVLSEIYQLPNRPAHLESSFWNEIDNNLDLRDRVILFQSVFDHQRSDHLGRFIGLLKQVVKDDSPVLFHILLQLYISKPELKNPELIELFIGASSFNRQQNTRLYESVFAQEIEYLVLQSKDYSRLTRKLFLSLSSKKLDLPIIGDLYHLIPKNQRDILVETHRMIYYGFRGDLKAVEEIYSSIRNKSCEADATYQRILDDYFKLTVKYDRRLDKNDLLALLKNSNSSKFQKDPYNLNLLHRYWKYQQPETVLESWDTIKDEIIGNRCIYYCLIRSASKFGCDRAEKLYVEMINRGIKPSYRHFVPIITKWTSIDVSKAEYWYEEMMRHCGRPHGYILEFLLRSYAKMGDVCGMKSVKHRYALHKIEVTDQAFPLLNLI